MPEYLAPGVYVEEISFRAKSIEGVSTSVAAFIGPTCYGPTAGTPELLTSFADFARIYGNVYPLQFEGAVQPQDNYMAHAVRAFFDNGGTKLYVTRVYQPAGDLLEGRAIFPPPLKCDVPPVTAPAVTLRARFPGSAGNMRVTFTATASSNVLVFTGSDLDKEHADPTKRAIRSVQEHDVVFITKDQPANVSSFSPLSPPETAVSEGLYDVVKVGDELQYRGLDMPAPTSPPGATLTRRDDLDPKYYRMYIITLSVRVLRTGRFEEEQVWNNLSPNPNSRNSLLDLFTQEPKSRLRYLTIPFAIGAITADTSGAALVRDLLGDVLRQVYFSLFSDRDLNGMSPPGTRPRPADLEKVCWLSCGKDGNLPTAESYHGEDSGQEKTGLMTFEDVDEISIVAAPGSSARYGDNPQRADAIVQDLIIHCQERMRYRVAVLESSDNQVLSEVREFRGKMDSTHAALYYPWITIVDPLDPDGRNEIEVPPGGYVAGIYARTDVRHGVFKAPANEVVLGAVDFETRLNKAQQDILNPMGVNCFRFFEGRGFRLWGARTISSDPEWKYVNVRRYFAYLEHSIDKGTQWAVFENNNDALWRNVQRTIEDFLFNEWRNGALLGAKPEQAFFVRCDRSTMTQNDLDNGRLVCLIGVAPVKPAEFVIFRIGQFTADARP